MFNSKKKLKHFRLLLLLLIAGLPYFSGCNELPSEVGYSFISDTVNIQSIQSTEANILTGVEPYLNRNNTINWGVVLVGKTDSLESVGLLRFGNIPDSLSYLREDDILEAYLSLKPGKYAIGNLSESRNFAFNIYRNKKIYTNETTWDSLYPQSRQFSPIIDLHETVGDFNGEIDLEKDTFDPINIDLAKPMIVDWMRKGADSVLREHHYGIALVAGEQTDVIHQFENAEIRDTTKKAPTVTVVYNNKDNETDTLIMASGADLNCPDAPLPAEDKLIIQGGVTYRTKIYIDLNSLPEFAGVHRAALKLTLDRKNSFIGNNGLDSAVYAYLVDEEGSEATHETLGSFAGDDIFEYKSMANLLEVIVRRKSKKGTIILRTTPGTLKENFHELDRMVFYGMNNPDISVRPKLKIIYSTRPEYKKKVSSEK